MARGTVAKEVVINKIAEIFGKDYLGESDKKYYVLADDGGETVQIAIALTCPKVEVEFANSPKETAVEEDAGDWDFSSPKPIPKDVAPKVNTISKEEEESLLAMMERLGL